MSASGSRRRVPGSSRTRPRPTASSSIRCATRVRWDDWPASWHSVEKSGEISAMVGVALGGKAYRDRGDLVGVSGFAQHADGARLGRDGSLTLYGRTTLDGPELSLPFMTS